MATNYTKLTKCVACDNHQLEQVLSLGAQPLANNYHNGDAGKKYPLVLNLCRQCSHTQLSVAVDPNLMFKHYLYVTGTSQTLRDYCDWFAQMVSGQIPTGTMCDIASNDGTQLDSFAKLGWKTMGIEPAENLVKDYKHYVINDFAQNVVDPLQLDVITAQNVLAHTADPLGIMKNIKKWLKPRGRAFIQTSQANMFKNGEFDTMYHEHISFFCSSSMAALCHRAGLKLINVQKTHIHGTSYVFTVTHDDGNHQDFFSIDPERYKMSTYQKFADDAINTLRAFKYRVREFKKKGYKVVGYGAAAKGMTVLNAGGIALDWIVDDNELKVGKMTPGMNTPILGSRTIAVDVPIVCVPLAWNFFDEIKAKVSHARGELPTVFYKYFPKQEIYEQKHINA